MSMVSVASIISIEQFDFKNIASLVNRVKNLWTPPEAEKFWTLQWKVLLPYKTFVFRKEI